MKAKLLNTIIFICILNGCFFAQEEGKSLGLGVSSTFAHPARIPWIASSVNVSYKYKTQQISLGIDCYQLIDRIKSRRIFGLNAGYQFNLTGHFFAGANLNYARFTDGYIKPAKIKYYDSGIFEDTYYNKVHSILLVGSIGIKQKLFKISEIYFLAGGGINYFHIYTSSKYKEHWGIDNPDAGNNFKPIPYFKIGWNFFLYNSKK